MVDESALLDVGLTSSEVKIYLALLELGTSSVTSISGRSNLHRTNVYDALKKLSGKGLVSCVSEDNVNYYSASSPNFLLRLVREKEAALCKILPQLQLSKSLARSSSISSFKGVSAVLECLHELLDLDSEVLVFGMSNQAIKLLGARIFPFHSERVARKILLRQIYSVSLKKLIKKDDEYTSSRFFSDPFVNASFILCRDTVLVVSWFDDVLTIKIKDDGISALLRVLFEFSWSSSSN
ncbi:MAG: TrmB family transcriptional regulator [Candidatus Woesearchaeota archaeon]